jgi:glycosyltransferase involved in cell wall biosynthesis
MNIICIKNDISAINNNIENFTNNNIDTITFYNLEVFVNTIEDLPDLIKNNILSINFMGNIKNTNSFIKEINYFYNHIKIWETINKPTLILNNSTNFDLDKYNHNDNILQINNLLNESNNIDIIFCNNLYSTFNENLVGYGDGFIINGKNVADKLLKLCVPFNLPLNLLINKLCNDNKLTYELISTPFLIKNDIVNNYRIDNTPLLDKIFTIKKQTFCIIASHPNLCTGYAKIATQIANYLSKYFNVIYLGFQNFNNNDNIRYVNPEIKVYDLYDLDKNSPSGFGDKAILPTLLKEKPDFVMIYNDHSVCSSVLKLISEYKCVKYCYLDLVYEYQLNENINFINENCDCIYAFSNSWKTHLEEYYKCKNVKVLYHGIETHNQISDKFLTREELGLKNDDFVILSVNRNDSRKNIDLVIKSFLIFLKNNYMNKNNIFLYLTRNLTHYLNILNYIKLECFRLNLIFEEVQQNFLTPSNQGKLTDTFIHSLYYHCDAGISITSGEGFGLTVIEHLCYNKPVICSKLKVFEELFTNDYFVEHSCEKYSYCSLGGIQYIYDTTHFIDKLQTVYDNRPIVDYTELKNKLKWNNIIYDFISTINNQ